MTIGTEDELRDLKAIGKIVAETLRLMGARLEPGMTTAELDEVGAAELERHGARSAPALAYGFPGATCISINNEIAHGVPGARRVLSGDLVNIDVSAEKEGFFADTGGTFIVSPATDAKRALCRTTRRALNRAVKSVRAGAPFNVIGHSIERVARRGGYSVIQNLHSHGVGRALHEEPSIAPVYDRDDRRRMRTGMVFTIEPFLSTGALWAEDGGDGWTLVTPPEFMTAQYEHSLVVTRSGAIVLTQ